MQVGEQADVKVGKTKKAMLPNKFLWLQLTELAVSKCFMILTHITLSLHLVCNPILGSQETAVEGQLGTDDSQTDKVGR